jgi:hypothetical protein
VARIAQDILEREDPAALAKAVSHIKDFSSGLTTAEGDHPFTECATFGDSIKRIGGGW